MKNTLGTGALLSLFVRFFILELSVTTVMCQDTTYKSSHELPLSFPRNWLLFYSNKSDSLNFQQILDRGHNNAFYLAMCWKTKRKFFFFPSLHNNHSFGLSMLGCSQPCTWEMGVEAGESGIQDHLPLHRKFKTSLGCMKPCLKKPRKWYSWIKYAAEGDSRSRAHWLKGQLLFLLLFPCFCDFQSWHIPWLLGASPSSSD